ncbi:MAG: c-type cytochrome [Planctomycetes bacterium]|nr:c-type cytochrome [Planctomycetota bacterium]
MSDPTPTGDSRPPLSLPISLVLVLLALAGNGLLLFWPRPAVAPVVADAGKPVTAPTTPTTPTQPTTPAQPAAANPAQAPTSPFAQAPTTPTQPAQPTPPKTEAPPKDVVERGLTLVVQSQAGGEIDQRTARVLSLYVPAGSAPTPFIAAGAFTATFNGFINKDVWDKVAFTAEGTGSLTFTVNGTEVLTFDGPDLASGKAGKIRLNKGANPISLAYKSPASGDAKLRLLWSGSEIPTEPVPATLFTHNTGTKEFRASAKLRSGRELVATMRCTKCHAADAATAEGMPELAMDAPDLREVGARLNQGWMAAWIRDPKALRAHASMPKLIVTDGKTDADMDGEAAAMAAYLATLGKGDDGALAADDAAVGRGGHLFAKLACASCHMANGDSPAHIALTHVKSKWKPKALAAFLREPAKHYAWIKMPTFGFTEAEATDLAAWLLKNGAEEPKKISGGDAGLGKVLMAGAGCASCHQLGDVPPVIGTKLKDLAQNRANGCLATDAVSRKRAPDYGFSGDEISALRGFIKTDHKSLAVRDHVEFAERRIDAQRCTSCHQRDGIQSTFSGMGGVMEKFVAGLPPAPAAVQHGEHGEGGAASGNPPPMLTFTGDKLRPEWTAKLLKGELPYRTRPWLDQRMPAFKAGADVIAQGLAMSHGLPPVSPAHPPSPGPGAEDGIKLLGADGGFNCNQCHSLGSAPAVAIFEAPGINLGYAGQRLQKDYYHRWMLSPLRFDPTTRMPKFAQDDGTTPLTDVLGGQARDQFEAIWQQLIETGKASDFPH